MMGTRKKECFEMVDEDRGKPRERVNKVEVDDGLTVTYFADRETVWNRGRVIEGNPDGYWEWFRLDGTLKRSGWFHKGKPYGEWISYDSKGHKDRSVNKGKKK
jgi:hypothetical protein